MLTPPQQYLRCPDRSTNVDFPFDCLISFTQKDANELEMLLTPPHRRLVDYSISDHYDEDGAWIT